MPMQDGDEPRSYRIADLDGRPIGRVPVPEGEPALGRGAGTVLLVRDLHPTPTFRLRAV